MTALRRSLLETLPDYMVPSVFVVLNALPVTPNGKLDRRALPVPGKARPDLENPFVPARTPVEKELSGIWSDILGLDQVGIYDNLFDPGGHSLLATQIASRALDTFRIQVPLDHLLRSPTVADMAAFLNREASRIIDKPGVPPDKRATAPAIPKGQKRKANVGKALTKADVEPGSEH